MITELPYNLKDIQIIRRFGATINLAKLNFYKYNELKQYNQIDLALIYLKNSNFKNIKLDFSNTSFQFKSEFLIKYIQYQHQLNFLELTNTINYLKSIDKCINNSIFSDVEAKTFLNLYPNIFNEAKSVKIQ